MIEYFELRGQVTGLESTGALWGTSVLDPDALDGDFSDSGSFAVWSSE